MSFNNVNIEMDNLVFGASLNSKGSSLLKGKILTLEVKDLHRFEAFKKRKTTRRIRRLEP